MIADRVAEFVARLSSRDRWALVFAIYFFVAIPASMAAALLSGRMVFLVALVVNAAVTLFIAWRRGDL